MSELQQLKTVHQAHSLKRLSLGEVAGKQLSIIDDFTKLSRYTSRRAVRLERTTDVAKVMTAIMHDNV